MAQTAQQERQTTEKPTGAPDLDGSAVKAPAPKPNRRPLIFAVLGVLGIAAVVYGAKFMIWSSSHVSTDDATISSDIIQIAPQVTGTVTSVPVSENQHVKKGDLLVDLDSSSFETAYLQAK